VVALPFAREHQAHPRFFADVVEACRLGQLGGPQKVLASLVRGSEQKTGRTRGESDARTEVLGNLDGLRDEAQPRNVRLERSASRARRPEEQGETSGDDRRDLQRALERDCDLIVESSDLGDRQIACADFSCDAGFTHAQDVVGM